MIECAKLVKDRKKCRSLRLRLVLKTANGKQISNKVTLKAKPKAIFIC